MNTYKISEWINTYHDITVMEAERMEFDDGQTLLFIGEEMVASIPNTKIVKKVTS